MRILVTTDSYEIEFSRRERKKMARENLEKICDLLQGQSYVMCKVRHDLQMEALKEGAGALHAMSDLSKIRLPREGE